nr:DUF4234 domain-containing protein [candidate division Zixibacteria bacterium]
MDQSVKYRNMWLQVLIMIVTLGFYAFYWFYQTASELKRIANDPYAEPGLWTFLLFIPFANLYADYKYSELYEKAFEKKNDRWVIFILWLFFSPAVWFIVQRDLNSKATWNLPGQPADQPHP